MNNYTRVSVDIILIDKNLPDIDKLEEFKRHITAFNPEIIIVEYSLNPITEIGICSAFNKATLHDE